MSRTSAPQPVHPRLPRQRRTNLVTPGAQHGLGSDDLSVLCLGAHQHPVRERDLIENEPRLKIVASGTATLARRRAVNSVRGRGGDVLHGPGGIASSQDRRRRGVGCALNSVPPSLPWPYQSRSCEQYRCISARVRSAVGRKHGAWAFLRSCAGAAGQVPAVAACRRFRIASRYRWVARPRATPRSGRRAFFLAGTLGDSLETPAEGSLNISEIRILAVAHGNRTRIGRFPLTPRRRTPTVDSRGIQAGSSAECIPHNSSLFAGI
jgi:hypothetical protein